MKLDRKCDVCLIPVPFPGEFLPGENLVEKLATALRHQKLKLRSDDVLVIKHKIISKAEGQVVPLDTVRPSRTALSWSRQQGSDPRVVELALREGRRIVRKK